MAICAPGWDRDSAGRHDLCMLLTADSEMGCFAMSRKGEFMRVRQTLLGVLLVIVLTGTSCAFASTPIIVQATGNDMVGQRLVYYFKEAIRTSASFRLSQGDEPGIEVRLVTLDPSSGDTGGSTVYSAVWTLANPKKYTEIYLTSVVGTCGTKRVHECAEDLLATTDEQRTGIMKVLSAASEK